MRVGLLAHKAVAETEEGTERLGDRGNADLALNRVGLCAVVSSSSRPPLEGVTGTTDEGLAPAKRLLA